MAIFVGGRQEVRIVGVSALWGDFVRIVDATHPGREWPWPVWALQADGGEVEIAAAVPRWCWCFGMSWTYGRLCQWGV